MQTERRGIYIRYMEEILSSEGFEILKTGYSGRLWMALLQQCSKSCWIRP